MLDPCRHLASPVCPPEEFNLTAKESISGSRREPIKIRRSITLLGLVLDAYRGRSPSWNNHEKTQPFLFAGNGTQGSDEGYFMCPVASGTTAGNQQITFL